MQPLNLVEDLKVRVMIYKGKNNFKNDFVLTITSLVTLLSYVSNLRKETMNVSIINN
jgi:hypothetical protein